MNWTNCRKVTLKDRRLIMEGPEEVLVLDEGYVGRDDASLHFRPDRGSGGFAVYDTAVKCRRNTGQEPVRVSIVLRF